MIFETLHDSAKRGELLLVDNGFCHWHLRRDGQLTIREIISTKRGAGSSMLKRLENTIGATSLFAKCPADLPANEWYAKRGFDEESREITKSGRELICWRKALPIQKHQNAMLGDKPIELIYCADGNRKFASIAIDAGWHYGAQLPNSIGYRPYFVDQDWQNPNLPAYLEALDKHRPYMATVLDFERVEQFEEVMQWCEAVAPYVHEVIVIPKAVGETWRIPESVAEKPVRLGYSVPTKSTKFAGTTVPFAEFGTRPVHLLGGSPRGWRAVLGELNVVSGDMNAHQHRAKKGDCYTDRGVTMPYPGCENDFMYHAFMVSCHNIKRWLADYQPKAQEQMSLLDAIGA